MILRNVHRVHTRLWNKRSSSVKNSLSICGYHSENGIYGYRPDLTPKEPSSGTVIKEEADKNRCAAPNVYRLVENFRTHAHRIAKVNLLLQDHEIDKSHTPEVHVERYGVRNDSSFNPKGIVHWKGISDRDHVSVAETLELLEKTYASQTGYEFMHLESEEEREWLASRIEETVLDELPSEYKLQLALEMTKCQNFDHFVASKFPNVKRYGGEGCETMMGVFLELLNSSSSLGVDHVVIGMPHRGRLNLMANFLNFPPSRMFQKMKGLPEFPPDARATGDVLTHLYTSVDIKSKDNYTVHFSLLPNPSHLEIINPVAVGKARAKLKHLKCYDYSDTDSNLNPRVLSIQIHGDAALAGQGVNQETLGFAYVPHFRVGGSLHLIVNNQIGFTTPAERGRSSRYTSDVAKMIGAPVIHVNGDYPENVVKATRIALEFRQKFHRDVFLDLICFRKRGHNEMDDPTFTNPQIYDRINSRKSIPDEYNLRLIEKDILRESHITETLEEHNAYLNEELKKAESSTPPAFYFQKQWAGIKQAGEVITEWDTGIDISLLKYIGHKSVQLPENFNVHPHLAKTFVKSRVGRVNDGDKIDWATAEALALGSLLYQGFDVRLSGEDVGRGTFSQRHVMLVDQKTGETYIPMNDLVQAGEVNGGDIKIGHIEVCNTTLSEEAVLGFEYGFSVDHPNNLVIWEAQFGDFFNGAQIVIDTMITSGETKWMLHSGLVILLPHGLDGVGPEHSSCRFERFLQQTDSAESGGDIVDGDHNNMQVVFPTTPAQYFHLLRRQMLRDFRKPLIIIAPKTLLRLSAAVSSLVDMAPGSTFQNILEDRQASPEKILRLVFVTGKHYYALEEKRVELGREDVTIVRIESLCPFPVKELQEVLKKFNNATEVVWSQEEHQNQGAWNFIKPRFENFLGCKIKYKGRRILATPAVGVGRVHRAEVEHIMNSTFE